MDPKNVKPKFEFSKEFENSIMKVIFSNTSSSAQEQKIFRSHLKSLYQLLEEQSILLENNTTGAMKQVDPSLSRDTRDMYDYQLNKAKGNENFVLFFFHLLYLQTQVKILSPEIKKHLFFVLAINLLNEELPTKYPQNQQCWKLLSIVFFEILKQKSKEFKLTPEENSYIETEINDLISNCQFDNISKTLKELKNLFAKCYPIILNSKIETNRILSLITLTITLYLLYSME